MSWDGDETGKLPGKAFVTIRSDGGTFGFKARS